MLAPSPGVGVGQRVLLVEDHLDSAMSIGRLLRLFGYEVHIATDGLEALRDARDFAPTAALIDLTLPTIDGFAVAEHLRERRATRDALLIAMTGWATEEHTARAKEAGFDAHLVKPISVNALLGALEPLATRTAAPRPRRARPCRTTRASHR